MTQPVLNLGFIDSCGERSTVSVAIPTINAGNFATEIAKYVVTDATNLIGKLLALTACRLCTATVQLPKSRQAETLPTGGTAVRELALLVSYQDNTTSKKYHIAIPGPDTSKLLAGTDNIDPTDADWIAFKSQFESDVLSEAGNTVTVLSGKLVGRNN